MIKSDRGLGISKHRKSGKSPKSPKLRHAMKREAEKEETKRKTQELPYKSVKDALSHAKIL